ncbi:MAG TPA: hypothetical protein VI643_06725 [Planctomycetota bacterium]|nr:hypothetical protein [Planctomycetota bacterium]
MAAQASFLVMALFATVFLLCQDADELVRKALEGAKAESSLKVTFTGRVDAPGSDPMDIHGAALQVGRDLLFIEYHASGGQLKFIVRKGDMVVEWHPVVEEWMDAQRLGDGAAGRGAQNPHEVFDTLLANRTGAKVLSRDDKVTRIEISLNGPKLRPLLRDLVNEQEVNWESTVAGSILELDSATGVLRSAETSASIGWREGKKIEYKGKVTVESLGKETDFRFFEKTPAGKALKEIPLTDDARKRLGLAQKR